MKITINNSGTRTTLDSIMTGSVRDGINGEYTLEFTIIGEETFLINDTTKIEYAEQYFNVIGYTYERYGLQPICNVKCEHVSYSLNEAVSDGIEFTGTPTQLLNLILSGTQFNTGIVESSQQIATSIHGNTYRRTVLNNLAGTVGCEIEYDGYNINLRQHRGSAEYIELLQTDNVISVSKNRDVLKGLTTYDVTLGRKTILQAGDNIHIKYDPLGINDYTRIIAIEYNPYNQFEVSIDVGDYTPDILDELSAAEQAAVEANETAQQANDTAYQANAAATAAADRVDTFDVRITDAETAVGEMQLTTNLFRVRLDSAEESITGMPSTIEAVIESSINGATGAIKLFVEGKNYLTQPQADGSYLKIANLNAGISTYINGATGKAEIVSACSSTYQKISDMNGYVTNATLNTSIGQYIDSQAGTAKIVSACSATYQTKAAMSDYVTTTNLNTSIGQYIDSQAGTAKIVSAVSATYQTISGMSSYVTTTNLNTTIGQYIDSTTGKAKIVSACSATYQTISGMSSYVTTTNLNTTIGQYIDSTTGKAKVVQAVSGTYQTVAGMSSYATSASVTTEINNKIASITLAVTNGTESSTLTLKSGSTTLSSANITFTGIVTFSDLSTASSSTVINGANIRTGTISADRIDASDIKMQTLWAGTGSTAKVAITSSGTLIYIGGNTSSASFQTLYLYASSEIRFGTWASSSYCFFMNPLDKVFGRNDSLGKLGTTANRWAAAYILDIYTKNITPSEGTGTSYLGTSSYRWSYLYASNADFVELDVSTEFTAYSAKLGGNASYHIVANTSRELRPNSTSTSYPCYLGTPSYPWQSAYIGSNLALLGTSTSSKLGFFGKTPIARPSVSSVSTSGTLANAITGINNLITALKNLGLIA